MSEVWDESAAARYDANNTSMFAPEVVEPTVDFLIELAAGRRILEFAVGTGRIALPLSERGADVSGIELSVPMAEKLRSKPGADRITVTIGDMAHAKALGSFGVVYLVFNTITNLLTQDEQVLCFENAASHLEPGGHFVIEVLLPELQRLPVGEHHTLFDVSEDHIGIDEYDVVNQMLVSHHVWSDGHRSRSSHRYAWPAEYDLMGRLAGLDLQERWSDWTRSPFTADSKRHVSVWVKPG